MTRQEKSISVNLRPKGISGNQRPKGISVNLHPKGISGNLRPKGISGNLRPKGISGNLRLGVSAMCLGIPAKVVEVRGLLGKAEVGGVRREVDLRLVEDVAVGDYVILHAGFAIQKLDEKEAQETLSLLQEMFQ